MLNTQTQRQEFIANKIFAALKSAGAIKDNRANQIEEAALNEIRDTLTQYGCDPINTPGAIEDATQKAKSLSPGHYRRARNEAGNVSDLLAHKTTDGRPQIYCDKPGVIENPDGNAVFLGLDREFKNV